MKKYIINIILFLLFVEIGSFIFSKNNLLITNSPPPLYSKKNETSISDFWIEESPWGAWRKANTSTYHQSQCFDVMYTSNEVGAKDDSFENIDKNNYIILGDSMASGYGSNNDDDFETILEKKLDTNILNFATAYDFGPLQYWMIYDKLAKFYEHNKIIIVLYPGNDFTDNQNDRFDKKRWRPYYKLNNDGSYDYFYNKEAKNKKIYKHSASLEKRFTLIKVKQFIKKNFWTTNTIRSINIIIQRFKSNYSPFSYIVEDVYSGYLDPKIDQQKAVIYFIEKIIESSYPKEVILVSIPRPQDFDKVNNNKDVLKNIYWHKELLNKDKVNKRFTFIDIINNRPKNIFDLYHTCDGHLSRFGNEWVADKIYEVINN
tara:strand:+ start:1194 stop:2312 length:1119 start_codon:yes stop_codon:yes gene_type:complete